MKKKLTNFLKSLVPVIIGIFGFTESQAQTVIASEGFNNSANLFTSTSGLGFVSGSSSSSQRPQSLPFASEGTHAGECANNNTTMSTGNINTSSYCNVKLSFRLAAWSNTVSNGLDGSDEVIVQISNDGGSTYREILKVTGSSSNNSFWHYSTGSATATANYATTVGAALFFPNGSGNRTSDGYSNLEITNLPSISNLRVRISLDCGSGERWTIDDFKLTGDATATTPTVTISVPSTSICSGASTTFSSSITNGGTTPNYQWLLNGSNISGATSASYTTSTLANNNQISLRVTSSGNCSPSATSAATTMTVNSNVTPTVSISVNNNNVCAGTSQTFSSSITNGGTSPSYQWTLNGSNISGATSSSFSSSSLSNGDVIGLILTSNANCRTANTATASTITAQINANVTPTVSISVNNNNVCSGTSQTFSSSITNGGTTPSYQWTSNGSNISGATSATYTSTSLSNGDVIGLVLTSNATCRTANTVSATTITSIIRSRTSGSISISSNKNSFCKNDLLTFTANTTSAGTSPSFSWQVNGVTVGNSSSFSVDTLTQNSSVRCIFSPSSDACPNSTNFNSNSIALTLIPSPSNVSITASTNNICTGSSVTLSPNATKTDTSSVTFFTTNFEPGATPWTRNTTPGGNSFNYYSSPYVNNGNTFSSNDASRFLFISSRGILNNMLGAAESPSFNTNDAVSATLNFYHHYNDYDSNDSATVQISTNGTNWTNLKVYNEDIGSRTAFALENSIAIPAGFLNQPNVLIRFLYAGNNDREWAIDNVSITGRKLVLPTFSWTSTNGFTSNSQNTVSSTLNNSTTFTLTATGSNGCATSVNSSITVSTNSIAGTIAGELTTCRGINLGSIYSVGKTGTVLKWQVSNNGSNWSDVPNSSKDTILYQNLTNNTFYRTVVKNGSCLESNSNASQIVLNKKTWTGNVNSSWSNAQNWCGGVPDSAESISIPNVSNKPNLDKNITIGDIELNDTLDLDNFKLNLVGQITGNGRLHTDSTSKLQISGNGSQIFIPLFHENIEISELTINRNGGAIIDKSIKIYQNLTLTNGNLEMGGKNVQFMKNATSTVGNTNSYLKTNGAGQVTKDFNSNETFTFPVGNSSYNAATITNKDGGIMGVRIEDLLRTDCASGNAITSESVNRTWHITKNGANVFGVDLTFQWNSTDELPQFNRSLCYASHCNSSNNTWEKLTSGSKSANGSGPYTISYTNYMGTFSPFGVGSGNGALPVTWVNVAAKKVNETTLVTWSTASEKGTDRFEIERSLNGKTFEKIGQVSAVGNSNTLQNYSFRDAQNIPSTSFYRIKSVDFDGTTEYSKTVMVQFNASQVSTFPNPTTGKIFLQGVEKAEIEIVNTLGKVVSKFNFNGNSNSEIDLAQLPDGIYFISITQNQTTQQIRVVKSNP